MMEYSGFVAVVAGFALFVLGQARKRENEVAREVQQDPAVVRRRLDSLRHWTILMTVVLVLSATAALGYGTVGAVVTVAGLLLAPTLSRGRLRRPWLWRGSAVAVGFVALVVIAGSAANQEGLVGAGGLPSGAVTLAEPESDLSAARIGDGATAEVAKEPATSRVGVGTQSEPPVGSGPPVSEASDAPRAEVPAAPPPVRTVTFVIESHPVAAPIFVSTNPAREVEWQIGVGSATIEVAPGTEITYSIRPTAGSGYETFYGRLTVDQAATHPVWLTPRPQTVAPNVNAFPADSPERAVALWFASYAREDWNAMVGMALPSQLQVGRQTVYNGIEGTYFFREFEQLVSLQRVWSNDTTAHVEVVWQHDMGRSQSTITVIRENASGQPDRRASWRISYLSAMSVRDVR